MKMDKENESIQANGSAHMVMTSGDIFQHQPHYWRMNRFVSARGQS